MITDFEMKVFESLSNAEMIEAIQQKFGERFESLTQEDLAVLLICLVNDNFTTSQILVAPINLNSGTHDFFKMAGQLSVIDSLKLAHTLLCQIMQAKGIVIW